MFDKTVTFVLIVAGSFANIRYNWKLEIPKFEILKFSCSITIAVLIIRINYLKTTYLAS